MAQLVEHALRERKVMGSSPGGCFVSSGSFRFHSGSVSGLAFFTSLALFQTSFQTSLHSAGIVYFVVKLALEWDFAVQSSTGVDFVVQLVLECSEVSTGLCSTEYKGSSTR